MNTYRRRRFRCTFKWGGAVVTVLLLIVWVGGTWWRVGMQTPFFSFAFRANCLEVWDNNGFNTLDERYRIIWRENDRSNGWWFSLIEIDYFSGGRGAVAVYVPIWFLALATATPTFLTWRGDRKRRPNTCPKCGY